ncbi:MAG: SDR family NAD(P)-dependent oxidoreductase [SAR324 cluster bacterium]|nr:SDR family NAD(P)-dependent oxidoreductase [SAR324 cluster bacterium]
MAIVTGVGGEHGIGRAIALRLAKEGADVVVSDLIANPKKSSTWAGLPSVVEEIECLGRKAIAIEADISNSAHVDQLVQGTIQQFGHIDILVNNAGSAAGPDRVPIVELEEEIWDQVQRINVKGTFLCCKAVAKELIKQGLGGKIINMSSIAGTKGITRFGAYCASKFAVRGLTQSLAKELGEYGIQVNAICPGMVVTERYYRIAEALAPEGVETEDFLNEMEKESISNTPLGRVATTNDVAKIAAFLASSESDFNTGMSFTVDGGNTMY